MSDDEDFVLSDAMSEDDFENDDADAEEEAALQRALLESKKMEAAAAKKRKKSSSSATKEKPAKKTKKATKKKEQTNKKARPKKSAKEKENEGKNGGKAAKKQKKVKLTAAQCKKQVSDYLEAQNRPYNLICLYENLHRSIPKPTMKSTLAALTEDGKVVSKPYGKQVVFFPNQSNFAVASTEDLAEYDTKLKQLEEELAAANRSVREANNRRASLAAEPTDDELEKQLNSLREEVTRQDEELESVQGPEAPKVDPNARNVLEAKVMKYVKLWKKRKRIAKDVMLDLCEGMNIKMNKLAEQIGVETDEEVKLDVKTFLA
eukprot:g4770.t1